MYDPNIPVGELSPASQVSEIMTNFAQFATVYEENHTDINTTNQGDHETILMTIQSTDPQVTDNFNVIYAKSVTTAAGTQPQLFSRIPVFLPNKLVNAKPGNLPIQLTYDQVNTSGPVYQSFLFGGYLFYFGTVSAIGSSNPITLSPTPSLIVAAIAYANTANSNIPLNVSTEFNANPAQFIINSSLGVGSYTFSWVAIAKQ